MNSNRWIFSSAMLEVGVCRIHILLMCLLILFSAHCQRLYQSGCPEMYMRYSSHHTACQAANPYCKIYDRGIIPQEKELIVKKHNYLRSLVALGYENRNNQPPAANMMQMVWDDELAAVAQKHADQCIFQHDCNDCRSVEAFSVGQNIATRARTGATLPTPNWDSVLQDLYDEVRYFNPKWIKPFRAPKYPQTGHYTQAIWATTWKVGCGYTIHSYSSDPRFQFTELYTCNYGPTGNMHMAEMYKIGPPCSQCPENTCCGKQCDYLGIRSEYGGLCKTVSRYGPQPGFPEGNVHLWCSFREGQPNRDWCDFLVDGARNWKTRNVVSGAYATVILTGGQRSTLEFTRVADLPHLLCIRVEYRKGPHRAGDISRNHLSGTLYSSETDSYYYFNFSSDSKDWVVSEIPVSWTGGLSKISLTFSVPSGAPPQYLDLREIVIREGRCRK